MRTVRKPSQAALLKAAHEEIETLHANYSKERTEMYMELKELRAKEYKRYLVTNSAKILKNVSRNIDRLADLLTNHGYQVLPSIQTSDKGNVITISVTPDDEIS